MNMGDPRASGYIDLAREVLAPQREVAQTARKGISHKHSPVILDNALRLATETSIGNWVAAESATKTLRELLTN
ncbi:hypothetical protein OAD85_01660 [Actinomycetota bacterium]|nr:hypothetical protein [Actinomycetota bacterium]